MSYDRAFLEAAKRLWGSADFEDVYDRRLEEILAEIVSLHPINDHVALVEVMFKYQGLVDFREYVIQLKNDAEKAKNA